MSTIPEGMDHAPAPTDPNGGLQNDAPKPDKRPWLKKYQWLKGQSGNRSGKRAGNVSITAAIKRQLSRGKALDAVAWGIIKAAAEGDSQALKLLMDRVDGPLKAEIENRISGQVALPLVQNVVFAIPSNGREKLANVETPTELLPEAATLPTRLPTGER